MKHIAKNKENNFFKEKKAYIFIVAIIIYIYMIINTKNILVDKPMSYTIVYIIVVALLFIMLLKIINYVIENEVKYEKLFLMCVVPLGIVYTLLMNGRI